MELVDERFHVGSYIHDGHSLYRVPSCESTPRHGLVPAHDSLRCENAATGYTVELDVAAVRRVCKLVRGPDLWGDGPDPALGRPPASGYRA